MAFGKLGAMGRGFGSLGVLGGAKGSTPPPTTDKILLEDGVSKVIQEDGTSKVIKEPTP